MEGTIGGTKRNKAYICHLTGEMRSKCKSPGIWRNVISQILENKTGRPGGNYNDGKKGIEENIPLSQDLVVVTPHKLFTRYMIMVF